MRREIRRRGRNRVRGVVLVAATVAAMAMAGAAGAQVAGTTLLVEEVIPGSPAARAGIVAGDRIASYDGRPVPSPAALGGVQDNTVGKQDVVVRVLRDGKDLPLTVSVGTLGVRVRPDLPIPAIAPYEEAAAAQRSKNLDEAAARFADAVRAAEEASDRSAAAWLYGRIGDLRVGQRRWKEATEAYTAAWEVRRLGTDLAAQSRLLASLGWCSRNASDLQAARRWYEQAIRLHEAAGFEQWAADDLTNLAAVVLAAGDLAQAQDYHSRALSIRQRLAPDSADVAASLSGLGIVAQRRGDLAGAQGYYARALAIQERVAPRSMTMAFLLGNMGTLAYDSDELAIAQDYHARALAIYDALAPDSLELATALNNLGLVAWRRGDLAAAEAYHRRALTIKEKLAPDSMTVAASLTNLGIVASARSDLAAAYDYQSRALAIREKLAPGSLDVAANLNNLGNVARNRGDLAASEAYHGRALAIREKLAPESLSVATSLNNLGETARRRGNLAAAHDFHVRALAINELRAPGSLSVAVSLTGLGTIAGSRGESEAARQYHRRALTIRERLAPASLETASSLNSLAGLALKAQQYSEALPLLNRASDIVEAQRWQIGSTDARALLLAQYAETYSGLRRCHLALGDVPAAFAVTERARARSLLESLAEARAGIRPSVDPQLLERERSIQQALNDATTRQTRLLGGPLDENKAAEAGRAVDALLVQYRQVQAEIRLKNPRYAALTQPQPLGLREIQQQVLDANSLLLEYSLGDEVSHLFAVTASAIRSFELPPRKDIERAARRVYELMTARQPVPGEALKTRQSRIAAADAGYPAAAAALSGMVLGPVVAELSTRRLLVVADGALQYVPFGALPAPGAATGHDPPLIVNHEIVNLPSASVIAVMRSEPGDRQAPARVVAVLADPVFDAADPRLKSSASAGAAPTAARTIPADVEQRIRTAGLIDERGSLSRLPFTRDEADAIVALAPSGQSTLAIDFRASRATVTSPELSQYRVVHLATHGLLDAERPELSGIVLSLVDERGAPQDGLLRLHEIYNLNWSADLVVLSACQTALGKEIKGEGLVGLTRGFMYGGARSVIASVWSVNDRATAELMKQFYRGLLVEGLSPPAALRTAQLDMLKRRPTRSPYYWAAFVVQGEWK